MAWFCCCIVQDIITSRKGVRQALHIAQETVHKDLSDEDLLSIINIQNMLLLHMFKTDQGLLLNDSTMRK
jgi:hypothetical protein